MRTLGLLFLILSACGGGDDDMSDTPDAAPPDLLVVNQSSTPVLSLETAPEDSPNWGDNILPETVPPGGEIGVYGFECDFFDVRVTIEDGLQCVYYGTDLCVDFVFTNADAAGCE